jgi:hypothetical protein
MESTLANAHDAELILKLYDLRREATMRQARKWMAVDFNPQSFEELAAVMTAWGSEHNAWFRQVTSYWEMAVAFVLQGALNGHLFLDCNGEPLYLYAKFQPFLAEARKLNPGLFRHTERLLEDYPMARERVEAMSKSLAARAEAAKANG